MPDYNKHRNSANPLVSVTDGSSQKMSGQIFISYRREESRWSARSLCDRLTEHFDPNQIFMDVDDIALGEDFLKAIEKRVGECDVLIAVIGAHWLTSTDEQGNRRLDNPEDFVRMEIATALKRDIRVIPVLVDGALMPRSTDLPDDLKQLVHRNALQIGDTHFDDDCRRLVAAIEQVLERNTAAQREREEKERLKNERLETEKKERLEAERRQKDEQERLENEPQSSPPGPDTSVLVDPPLGEKASAEVEVKTDYPTATRHKADVSRKDTAVPVERVEVRQPRIPSAFLRIRTRKNDGLLTFF
jgi:hypothetical protein